MPDTYPAIYRGSVYDVDDPENLGRLRLLVPQVLGDAPSGWAEPTLSPTKDYRPAVEDRCWVFFEGGDINHPTYISRMAVTSEVTEPGLLGDLVDADPSVIPEIDDGKVPAKVVGVTTQEAKGLIFVRWPLVTTNVLGGPQTSRVRYKVYISDNAAFTPGPTTLLTTTDSNLISVRTLADGTKLDYIEPDLLPDGVTANPLAGTKKVYFFIVVANDIDGDGLPSDAVNGSMDKNGSEDIAFGSITAEHLTGILIIGNTITTRSLDPVTGLLTGAGYTLTGRSLIAYDALGNKRLEIDPTNNTFVFRGDGEIDHLTVQTLTTLQRTVLAQDSVFTLQSAVSAPTNPLTPSFAWDQFQFVDDGDWGTRNGWSSDGSGYWYNARQQGNAIYLHKWSAATGYIWVYNHIFPAGGVDAVHGTVFAGSPGNFYVLYHSPVSGGTWSILSVDSNLNGPTITALSGTTAQLPDGYTRGVALGYDSATGQLLLAQARPTNGYKVRVQRLNATTFNWGSAVNSTFAYNNNLSSILVGTFDFGATRYIFGNFGGSPYKVMDTSGNEQTGDEWDNANAGVGTRGLFWDGADFFTVSLSGLMSKYDSQAGNRWSSPADAEWTLGYTYRGPQFNITGTRTSGSAVITAVSDTLQIGVGMPLFGVGLNTGTTVLSVGPGATFTMSAPALSSGTGTITVGPGETPVGDTLSAFTMQKRSQLVATMANLPVGVDSVGVYLAKTATAPSPSTLSMIEQGVTASGVVESPTFVITNANFTPPNNNPLLSSFGPGVPSKFQSQGGDAIGPYIDIWGDGAFRMGWLAGTNLGANPLAKIKAADQTVTNSTTMIDCADMAFPVVNGHTYRFIAVVRNMGNFTGDIKIGFTFPNGEMTAMFLGPDTADLTAGTSSKVNMVSRQGSANVLTTSAFGTSTSFTHVLVFGTFVATQSGTVQLQFAQNTADLTGTQVNHGSFIVGERMA